MSDQRYLVTARKYRPLVFGDLVAQQHVTETLKNAIRLDRLAHAYLFSGPRGVGKTTAARILAKAINCTTPPEERADAAEPCRRCASCASFEEGRSLNIIEIDAASNNRVDDIRDLRETVRVPPQGSRKKVYIVDEVHMLSTAAFNALLKTLEEPPPYALFIFATTEPHKVLPTILSRCQRFDFRRIPVPEIVACLREICDAENITADEASLLLIARKGDGALRDALSAFDQAVSLCGAHLRYAELAQALGVVDVDHFFEVTDGVRDGSAAAMLTLADRLVRAGYDLHDFLAGLAEHLRNALVAKTVADPALIEATEAVRARYAELADAFEEADLLRLLTVVDDAEEAIRNSVQPRLKLELALLKMASMPHAVDLREALAAIDRLEARVADGSLPAAPAREPQPHPAEDRLSEGRTPEAHATGDHPAPAAEAPRRSGTIHPFRPSAPEGPGASPASRDHRPPRTDTDERAPAPERPAAAHPEQARPEQARPEQARPEQVDEDAAPARDGREERRDAPAPPQAAPKRAPQEPARRAPAEAPREAPPAMPGLFGPPALGTRSAGDAPEGGEGPSNRTGAGATSDAFFAGSAALAPRPRPAAAPEPAPAADAPPASRPDAAPDPRLRALERAWKDVIRAVMAASIQTGALLQSCRPAGFADGAVTVAVPDDFHRRMLERQSDLLLEHLAAHDVTELVVTIQARAAAPAAAAEPADVDPHAYMAKKRQESPVVRAIFEQFGGELVW